MRALLILLLLAGSVVLCSCSKTESYSAQGFDFSALDRVAVLDVTGEVPGEAARNQIADLFTMELLKKGYMPVERTRVQAILAEQEFQLSEATSSDQAVAAGRILNVPAVLLANVPTFKEDISITAKLVDVESGSVLWVASGSGTTGKTLATIAGAAAGATVGVAATGEDDEVIGGVAGGVLGGVAGRALSPQESAKAKKIISGMCKELPYRR